MTLERNPLDFPDPSRLSDLNLNLQALYDSLPPGWVFAGVMRRADSPFAVSDDDRYVSIATLESPSELGPIPEIYGSGKDMVAAIVDLRTKVQEIYNTGNATADFAGKSLTDEAVS